MWYFFSAVGTFIIAIEPSGEFGLWIDTDKLAIFSCPEDAVESVRCQKSGYAPWDELKDANPPEDLAGWMVMPGTAL